MEKRLDEMNVGEKGRIVRIEKGCAKKLMDMGVTVGTEIKVVRKAPLGDPVEFFLKGYNLSLRKRDGSAIWVRIIES